ncbi:GNAT family N-acetyltransferase [Rheinheimera texasensis]|uniref:GNAT family N-acetyltransferase n=1 Tax=Rheinheimera texasensis TaxID=306205 RepID=UPI0032B1C04B
MLSVADFALEQAGCRLRPVCAADAPVMAAIYTDARTQQFVGQLLSQTEAMARIEACARANQQSELQKFYLALENPQQLLAGMLAVFDVTPAAGTLELGIMLLPDRQQAGLAKTAYSALMQRALLLGFEVQVSIHPENLAAIRLARQCGMQLMQSTATALRYRYCG